MNRNTLIAVISIALAAFSASPAAAQNARSFVSGHGNDANSCLYAAPCRTFAGAYPKTNAGGEISVLDPAGFGPLTITHALSIVNDGVGEASIVLVAAGSAITINAGASDAVSLRGLTLDGSGTTNTSGIVFNSGAALTVQNCVVRHFNGVGINFQPNAASNLAVSNSLLADNAFDGVLIAPTGAGAVTAALNRVEMNNNGRYGIGISGGFATGGTVDATVFESVAAKIAGFGYYVSTSATMPATLTLVRSVAANNSGGIFASGAGATARLAQSAVIANTTFGWSALNSGVIASYGDNYIDGNGPNTGSLTSIGKQ
jgi:hypothetical protein